jgi:hypothetical protein
LAFDVDPVAGIYDPFGFDLIVVFLLYATIIIDFLIIFAVDLWAKNSVLRLYSHHPFRRLLVGSSLLIASKL